MINTDEILEELQLRALLKDAHCGDAAARDTYESIIKEAEDNHDEMRKLWLFYLRATVLAELLQEHLDKLERKPKKRGTC